MTVLSPPKRLRVKFCRRTLTAYSKTLEYQLLEILQKHAGERAGDSEGAVDTLCRIIHERDRAFEMLALDRLRNA